MMIGFNEQNVNKQFTCCICHKICYGYGNNPHPLVIKKGSRCCDECDRLVIAARLYMSANIRSVEEMERFVRMPLRKKLARMEKHFSDKKADRMGCSLQD